jgi:hypothetical protein
MNVNINEEPTNTASETLTHKLLNQEDIDGLISARSISFGLAQIRPFRFADSCFSQEYLTLFDIF